MRGKFCSRVELNQSICGHSYIIVLMRLPADFRNWIRALRTNLVASSSGGHRVAATCAYLRDMTHTMLTS